MPIATIATLQFDVEAVTIWPFGPQMFVCSKPINSVADPQNMNWRRFTASMSETLTELGARSVPLSILKLYPALEREVTSCSVTSPISANAGKRPEATEFPIPLSGSVQAHLLNLGWWRC
ncbi:hypothetical protein [Paracoccus sp. PAR01]|uniref:hypothetical protein n=1 Tax=Paracoccus sp. PAR01 TaxID=2769282 RepID=UPI00177FC60A|nr:hypothetical protein [Paracoccus sp. PAR01]MBD9528558.1 hypothetical protein [Paracoccus sp. PAR01]